MSAACTHDAMRIRYTDSLLGSRLKGITSELSHIYGYCTGEEAALVRWCVLTVEHVVRVLDARAAFAADEVGEESRRGAA